MELMMDAPIEVLDEDITPEDVTSQQISFLYDVEAKSQDGQEDIDAIERFGMEDKNKSRDNYERHHPNTVARSHGDHGKRVKVPKGSVGWGEDGIDDMKPLNEELAPILDDNVFEKNPPQEDTSIDIRTYRNHYNKSTGTYEFPDTDVTKEGAEEITSILPPELPKSKIKEAKREKFFGNRG